MQMSGIEVRSALLIAILVAQISLWNSIGHFKVLPRFVILIVVSIFFIQT